MNKTVTGVVQQIMVLCGGLLLLVAGCRGSSERSADTLFERIPSSRSGITFSNDLTFDNSFNVFTYTDFYAGGGVALADVNGDGRTDIFLTANQESNRLYLNRGDFRFEDVTGAAGVGGAQPWSTGAAIADVNADGRPDIYVTHSAAPRGEDRRNELFINNGDGSFSERAGAWGLDDAGYSVHAAFFDYDRDGDLDMYLLNNHNSKPIGRYDLRRNHRGERSPEGGDRLYRNDGERFSDVSEQAGIYGSEIGFGLGVSVGDLNRDGWPDLYVSNDFFERDYLYLNNGDGTFREVLEQTLPSISTTSMGSDIADLTGDGYPEIFVSDMLPEKEDRLKTVTDFIGWEQYREEVELGYHRKFTRNTLQLNNADGTFSEVGRYAGVEATDWSWGALMADFNLDGRRDIFVANGFYKDVTDKDHLLHISQDEVRRSVITNNQIDYRKLVEMTPSVPLPNYVFENGGDLRFVNRSEAWGLDTPGFSNGSAWGDLDSDGDLDLVVNNVNMEAFVYRNRAAGRHPGRGWLAIELAGQAPNTAGVGARVELVAGGRRWHGEQMPQRGFQSSVDPIVHVGLGEGIDTLDTVRVRWPDGRVSLQRQVPARRRVVVRQAEAEAATAADAGPGVSASSSSSGKSGAGVPSLLADITGRAGPADWRHAESEYNDFAHAPLTFHMRSGEGPPLCSGDADGDGRAEVYAGGAAGQAGVLLVAGPGGRLQATAQPALALDRASEDTGCVFADIDGDGRAELYVGSGSSEFAAGSPALADRLYRLGAGGRLVGDEQALPRPEGGHRPTGAVAAGDVDGDGRPELFVGVRLAPRAYGVPVGGYLLSGDGAGGLQEATARLAPDLQAGRLGAAGVTAAAWGDLDSDGHQDLVVAGEWMPLTVLLNRGGRLERAGPGATGLAGAGGWWQSLTLADLDGDGDLDLVGGNHGLNTRLRAGRQAPLELWAGDMDRNGSIEQIFGARGPGREGPYPLALRHDLLMELPQLKARYPSYAAYAGQRVTDIFSGEQLGGAAHHRAGQLASVVGWNDGAGRFRLEELPRAAQLAPMYAVLARDLNGDGRAELLLGGNLYEARPQAGRYDASYGVVLSQDPTGRYREVPPAQSGFFVPGQIRSLHPLSGPDGETLILAGRNDEPLKVFKVQHQ